MTERPARILVVDDVPGNVRLLEAVLVLRDYAAIGSVTNLASRLAWRGSRGQILIAQRLYAEIEDRVEVESAGEFTLKGFARPVAAFSVLNVSG